jgi:hypothetical protein
MFATYAAHGSRFDLIILIMKTNEKRKEEKRREERRREGKRRNGAE